MGLLSGGPTFGGIFIFEIWWAYYPVSLVSSGLSYGILRYFAGEYRKMHIKRNIRTIIINNKNSSQCKVISTSILNNLMYFTSCSVYLKNNGIAI